MPTVEDNFFYQDIAAGLEAKNKPQIHKYFYSQKYIPQDNKTPFGSILPLVDDFFGPKNLTLLILSKPYQIDDTLLAAQILRFQNNYKKWSVYKVMIWIDMVLAIKMLNDGDHDFYNNMQDFSNTIQGICDQLKDYGFNYMGQLLDGKDANYFQPYIDDFYKD